MSYLQAGTVTLNRTAGGIQSSTGSTNLLASIHSTTQQGDISVLVAYCGGDPTPGLVDINYGWRTFTGYDAAGFGLIVAVAKSRGLYYQQDSLTLPASMAWASVTRAIYFPNNGSCPKIDISKATFGSFYSATASDTTITVNPRQTPYAQCIEIVGFGSNNGGTVRTLSSMTGYTELVDTGVTSPAYGVGCYYRIHYNSYFIDTGPTVTISGPGGTNRTSLSLFIPITSQMINPNRNLSYRSFG
jgi:hypothetical protein